jgi:glycerol uptake facilitator-like aquaporin
MAAQWLMLKFQVHHPVAILVWAGLSLGTTGYAINPARDLGPRIAIPQKE